MKIINSFIAFLLVSLSANVFAYGGGGAGGTKSCTKPKFKNFAPKHLETVAPQSEFSFTTPSSTSPSSIEVTIKKKPIAVDVKKTKKGYLVSGKLPETLDGNFARINIEGKTVSKCFGSAGWLVKIEG